MGDLLEQYQRGRSRGWFWRQVTRATVVMLGRDLRSHWLLAVRAMVVGLVLADMAIRPLNWIWSVVDTPFLRVTVWLGLRHEMALLSGLARVALSLPMWFGIGWVIARFHRTETLAIVLGFVVLIWGFALPETARLAVDAFSSSRFVPYLVMNLFGNLVAAGSLIGGARWRRDSTSEFKCLPSSS